MPKKIPQDEEEGTAYVDLDPLRSTMMGLFGLTILLVAVIVIMVGVLLSRGGPPPPPPAPVVAPLAPVAAPAPATFPALPGVAAAANGRPKLIMAQDINWPPYAYMAVPPESDFSVAGFAYDIINGMGDLCGWDVTVVQTNWAKCWDAGQIGEDLLNGVFHGCMTYTNTVGERNRFVEFSQSILQANKPAGLIVALDEAGTPRVDGNSNLNSLRVVDVVGWAPTADTLAVGMNDCTNTRFEGFEMVNPTVGTEENPNPNDDALRYLLNGDADAMWVYADQAYNYRADQDGVTPSWDTTLWARFGQPNGFAYIHTGMLEHTNNGTTLGLSRKGSGVADLLNPCLQQYLQTEAYHDICQHHHLADSCFANSFFNTSEAHDATHFYMLSTPDLAAHDQSCSTGYCACPPAPAATT